MGGSQARVCLTSGSVSCLNELLSHCGRGVLEGEEAGGGREREKVEERQSERRQARERPSVSQR